MNSSKKTRVAILGLLLGQPLSGYDIKKLIEVGLSHFWSESYGSIYPTLKSLVEEGLLTKEEDAGAGLRPRHLYQITESGRLAFREWMDQPTALPSVRNELLLKFFLSEKLPKAICLKIVRSYLAQQEAVLQAYEQSFAVLEAAMESGKYPAELEELIAMQVAKASVKRKKRQCKFFLLSLRHGILAVKARIEWCKEALQAL